MSRSESPDDRSLPSDEAMSTSQEANPIDVIDEHEDLFQTIADEADDSRIAKKFGETPLELLELDRQRGDQE